jgi:hypothetical protein
MSRIGRVFSPYFNLTSSLKYSYMVALPLLVIYEVLILVSQPDAENAVRLTADIWFKTIFAYMGVDTLKFTFLIAIVMGVVIYFIEKDKPIAVRPRFFVFMILESTFYAIAVAMLVSGFLGMLFGAVAADSFGSLTTLQKFTLSLGAGLYEELVFRVLLVGALLYLFKWLGFGNGWKQAAAMITAAMIFSAVHYTGSMGDVFTLQSFMFRFMFGLALNGLLIFRGFGIAVLTHSIYDVIVVLLT